MQKKISQSNRIIVGCDKTGKQWTIWHKNMPKNSVGKKHPQGCNLKNIAEKLDRLARKAGMITERK